MTIRIEEAQNVRFCFAFPKADPLNGVEALAHVWLHSMWISRLRHDLKQLVIGEEVEAWESPSLRLEVFLQTLLHALEGFVVGIERVQETGVVHID